MSLNPEQTAIDARVGALVMRGSNVRSVRELRTRGPAPLDLYASLILVDATPRGLPERRHRAATGDTELLSLVDAKYSVQWYREGASDAAALFLMWVESDESERFQLGAPPFTMEKAERLSLPHSLVGDRWEERAAVDLDISYFQTYTASVDRITDFDIAAKMEGGTEAVLEVNQ